MANVQKSIGFRRKAGANVVITAAGKIFLNEFLDKIRGTTFLCGHMRDLLVEIFLIITRIFFRKQHDRVNLPAQQPQWANLRQAAAGDSLGDSEIASALADVSGAFSAR